MVASFAFTSRPTYPTSLSANGEVLNCMIAYNKYGGYCTPISSNQRPVVQQILKGRIHEKDTIDYIREHCKDGDVVHAGTYFGDFLPGISRALSPNARIWAFEPNAENFKCAQITIILNGLENVVLRHAGLGADESVQRLLIQTADGVNLGGTSRIVGQEENGESEAIRIVSIDKSVPPDRNISIIQLDVEGYEKEVLQGAMQTIKRCKPTLILEINNIDLTKASWFQENILSMGYAVSGRVHMNTVVAYKGT